MASCGGGGGAVGTPPDPPRPSPSAQPTASPSISPSATPTVPPSPPVSPSPSPSPTSTPIACNIPAVDDKRWNVKIGIDADVGSVNLGPQSTTIQSLRTLAAPPTPLPNDNRIKPTETTVFGLTNVTLIWLKSNPDYDYTMVVQDGGGRTMIVEAPNALCAQTVPSRFRPQMAAVRKAIDSQFTVTSTGQNPNVPVTITGVGFFDYAYYNAYGEAPNGIELHPLLSFCAGQNCTPGS